MARSMGAKGTRSYQQRSGSNTSVRSNQMSRHQTPARSAAVATAKNGQRVSGAPSSSSQQAMTIRSGLVYTNRKGTAASAQAFRAPAGMPARLNQTAAAAVRVQQSRSISGYLAATIPVYGQIIGAAGLIGARSLNNKNGRATVRLKAAGYKVAKTGITSTIKPASAKTQARAKAKLSASKNTASRSVNKVGSRPKGSPAKGGGRRNFRPRRDSKGRWAGSY